MPTDLTEISEAQISRIKETKKNCFEVVVGPFARNFGGAMGNAIRRILLSSIPGAAVTEVNIANAPHEYSILEGVQEDVVEISNLSQTNKDDLISYDVVVSIPAVQIFKNFFYTT